MTILKSEISKEGLQLDDRVGAENSDLKNLFDQLVDDGYAELTSNGKIVKWEALFRLLKDENYKSSESLLNLPPMREWRPCLGSAGGLSDPEFKVTLESWIDSSGQPRVGAFTMVGPVLTFGEERVIVSEAAWKTVEGVKAFHQRAAKARTRDDNLKAWSMLRKSAMIAGAQLSNYLQNTVIVTADSLKIEMRKTQFDSANTVELMPTFEGAPTRWLEIFDRQVTVPERYDVPDNELMTTVLLTDDVRTVLSAIRKMPLRRVAGDAAARFVRNPFATLGPAAEQVIDAEEFEKGRLDAGLTLSRFIAQIEVIAWPPKVGLLIDEVGEGIATSHVYRFARVQDLEKFNDRLQQAIGNQSQSLFWEGFDLEVLGDSSDQLDTLKAAATIWMERRSPTADELLNLERFSSRIGGFGEERPYYSPFISKIAESGGWVPENLVYGFSVTSPESGESHTIQLDKDSIEEFRAAASGARSRNEGSFSFPGCSTPVITVEAESILQHFDRVIDTQRAGSAGTDGQPSKEGLHKTVRFTAVIKPNIDQVDYAEQRSAILNADETTAIIPKSLLKSTKLKDHQIDGLAWLQHLYGLGPQHCSGALLADDMGLGKTLLCLSFIASCLESKPELDPVLVVAPVSLLENWNEEITKFFRAAALPTTLLYGDDLASSRLPQAEIDDTLRDKGVTRLLKAGWLGGARIVLTTYETLRDLEFSLAMQRWSIMICDEAQKIKNPNALVTRAAKKQNARFKIACTGTPVENSLTDLWCLFDFFQPGLLGALNSFGRTYRRPIEAKTEEDRVRVEELRALVQPQMLRRMKSDVAKELPPLIVDQECRTLNMSPTQRSLYSMTVAAFKNQQTESKSLNSLGLLQNLRRLCSDPRALSLSGATSFDGDISVSPKLEWLVRILTGVKAKQEKAIVFCEMREIQRLLQNVIGEELGIRPEIVNGDTSVSSKALFSRQKRIKQFAGVNGFNVLILSPLSAGFGLNIQAATHVVHFTRMWNPAKEDQATDRAYRIGQDRPVTVYCPVVRSDFITFDEKLDELLAWKRELSRDVLNGTGDIGSVEFGAVQDVDGSPIVEPERITSENLSSLRSDAFEALCAVLWRKLGYPMTVLMDRKDDGGGDGGVDVLAFKGKSAREGLLIQCKSSLLSGSGRYRARQS